MINLQPSNPLAFPFHSHASPLEVFVLHTSCYLRLLARSAHLQGAAEWPQTFSPPGYNAQDPVHLSISFWEHSSYLLAMQIARQERPRVGNMGGACMGSPSTPGSWGEVQDGTARQKLLGTPQSRAPVPVSPLKSCGAWATFFALSVP